MLKGKHLVFYFLPIGFIYINIVSIRWDDPFGPVLLTMLLIFALSAEFVLKVNNLFFAIIDMLIDVFIMTHFTAN